jgi:hypothetical protein
MGSRGGKIRTSFVGVDGHRRETGFCSSTFVSTPIGYGAPPQPTSTGDTLLIRGTGRFENGCPRTRYGPIFNRLLCPLDETITFLPRLQSRHHQHGASRKPRIAVTYAEMETTGLAHTGTPAHRHTEELRHSRRKRRLTGQTPDPRVRLHRVCRNCNAMKFGAFDHIDCNLVPLDRPASSLSR